VLAERVEYLDENGKLVTESLRDYSRKGHPRSTSPASTTFLRRWNSERKQAMIDELAEEGCCSSRGRWRSAKTSTPSI
jgi:type I restriction enzyme R subunit